jgi:hypothetical protein
MALQLTDIRCGCGGLCDSGEPCPMRGNVQACACGTTTVTHALGQPGCLYMRAARPAPVRHLQQIRGSLTMNIPPIPIGARVHVSDQYYSGVAIVSKASGPGGAIRARLEYMPPNEGGPYYCHLIDLCVHEGTDEACDDPNDECMGEACRGWYAIASEELT